MSLFDLQGKIALVTGGGSGIGLVMAAALAENGAKVVIAARDRAKGERALEQIPGGSFLQLDTGIPESCHETIDAVVAQHGGLDILVNNSGTNIASPPQDFSLEEWHTVLNVNLTGPFLLCQRAYPHMLRRGGGKIINTGSMATLFGTAVAAPYSASKGGIGQLTKSLAVAWAKDNIQVNAILPGYVDTELVQQAMVDRPQLLDRILARTPAGRIGRPADFAGVALFLASGASDFITGALIPVDGGYMSQA